MAPRNSARTKMAAIQVSSTPDAALALLRKLAEDDKFRRDFQRNPQKTLATLDIIVFNLPTRVKLPPKAQLQTALQRVSSMPAPAGRAQPTASYVFVAFFAFFLA